MPKLSVCPFSIAVFVATAAAVSIAIALQKKHKTQTKSSQSGQQVFQVVFVLGAPGVGKGTQCQLLTERLAVEWVHLSAGDLLRAERKSSSSLGEEINACIVAGKIVDSKITCRLLENAMKAAYDASGAMHFLIDGFPRSQGNTDAWNTTMASHYVMFLLNYECPEETLIGRLLERGKSSGRVDDNLEVIQKRFDTFQAETTPLLEHYRSNTTIPVHTIATDKPVEAVYKETIQYFA